MPVAVARPSSRLLREKQSVREEQSVRAMEGMNFLNFISASEK